MASTKTLTVIRDNVTMTAGAGDATSTGHSLEDGYGATALIKITNGGTGPTVAGQVQIQVSGDDSNYYDYGGPLIAELGNSVVTSWSIPISKNVEFIEFVSGSNTDQDCTLRIEVDEMATI